MSVKSRSDKNTSPVGWYVATYLLRFVELERTDVNDLDARFISWENTILVKASDLDEAYDKVVGFAKESTVPYTGGPDGVSVQWQFEGVTELLPIYEELDDGSEISWAEYAPKKLRSLRSSVRAKGEFHQ